MGIIRMIINFFKRLFGLDSTEQRALSAGASAARSASAQAGSAATDDQSSPDTEEEDYAKEQWREMQEFIARCEAEGINLGGMDLNDPVTYWQKAMAIEEAESQGQDRDQMILQEGFANADEWEKAHTYYTNKWSHLVTNEDGELEVQQKDEFVNGAMKARQGQMGQQLASAEAANPQLLEPVEGITVEKWAEVAAGFTKLPPTATPDQVNQYLAGHGMDKAMYDRVNGEWTNRMSQDHTMVISNKYAAAFSGSMGVSEGGAEPVPFERFVEVMAAQEAWAASGMDVNAQLQTTFGIDAATYGSWGTYWSPKMSTDIALMNQYDALRQKYLQKYQGAGMDDDLSL
jgi:hypothetical protein